MKVINKVTAVRRYHISLLVFLLALGLMPASLMTEGVKAETEQVVSGQADKLQETPETKTEAEIVKVESVEIAEEYEVSEPVYEAPANQINIAGNTIPIFYSDNTLVDAGYQVGLYGSHFLYGHNTSEVFGGLSNMGVGSYFTVTLDGVTRTYQVVNTDLQTKTHFEGETIHKSSMSGMTVMTRMKIMKAMTAYGEYNGNYYDYILMTCAGTSYGNGDASHRLILMANEV